MKYLWVNSDGQTSWLWKPLAIGLAARLGLRPLIIVQSPQDKRLLLDKEPKGFDGEIVVREDVYSNVVNGTLSAGTTSQEIFRRSRQIENDYDISLVRDIILSDRHFGRGFLIGGKGYGQSIVSKKADFVSSLGACNQMFGFFENLYTKAPPKLLIGMGCQQGLFGRPVAEICMKNGVPVRSILSSRFGPQLYWSDDVFEGSQAFEQFYSEFRNATDDDVTEVTRIVVPNIMHTSPIQHANFRNRTSIIRNAAAITKRTLQYYYGLMRGYRKSRVGTHPLDRAKEVLRFRQHLIFLDKTGVRNFDDCADRKKVFFPLQCEPEITTTSLDVYLPNQLAVIHDLAISLPPDAVLLVKEHIWQIGLRDIGFYKTILEMPNVRFLHYGLDGISIAARSDLVCTLTGSSGHEAAALGVPVLRYGQKGPIFLLDHVHRASGWGDRALIRSILEDSGDEARRNRRFQGAKFVAALKAFCFDLGSIDIFDKRSKIDEATIDTLNAHLVRSLNGEVRPN